MTLTAFVLVFLSAFLHATWNFLSKKGNPSGAFYLITSCTAVLATSVFFITSELPLGDLPLKFWMFYLFSVGFEVCYALGLAYGYKAADISLVYPLGRATPLLLIAVISIVFGLGKVPSGLALVGMGIITIGCIMLPLESFKNFSIRAYCNKKLVFILPIAIGTTGYTLMDSQAGKVLQEFAVGNSFSKSMWYLFLIESGIAVSLFVFTLLMPNERREFRTLIRKPVSPIIAGLCSSTASGMVLVAMNYVRNVSYLQAFRQISLPLGVFAGILLLKENPAPPKLTGVFLITAGLVMTVL